MFPCPLSRVPASLSKIYTSLENEWRAAPAYAFGPGKRGYIPPNPSLARFFAIWLERVSSPLVLHIRSDKMTSLWHLPKLLILVILRQGQVVNYH